MTFKSANSSMDNSKVSFWHFGPHFGTLEHLLANQDAVFYSSTHNSFLVIL